MQIDSSINASPLTFEKLPEVNQDGSQWADCEMNNVIDVVYQNLNKLESYISILVRPSTIPISSLILVTFVVYI